MCGIAGFYGLRDDKLLNKFSQQLAHRGPDGQGVYVTDKISLLNRRLAIIDVKGGDQPIYNEDRSLVTVYNGEIYNYRELRSSLEALGHRFITHSDTEVVVHGYESWGENCFDKFNGMFAVALYDNKNERLILARDHFGIKPLYFSLTKSGQLVFSSEIKPIFFSGLINQAPNDRVIYRYLKYRIHDDGRETFFDQIYRLLPGELLMARLKKTQGEVFAVEHRLQSYTNLRSQLEKMAKSSAGQTLDEIRLTRFRSELTRSIRSRLVSEVPVGTCLSGGLDSSTVVAIANRLSREKSKDAVALGKKQQTFSAVFPGAINDEEKYIDCLFNKTLGTTAQGHKVKPTPEEFFRDLGDFIRTQEEPTVSTGPYAQYRVMALAHGRVTVLLDGQGADEMLAGYLPYYFVYFNQLRLAGQYRRLAREMFLARDVVWRYVWEKFKMKFGVVKSPDVDDLIDQAFRLRHLNERFNVNRVNLKQRLIEDVFANSLPSLLRYEDRNSMRFSIEGRVPFLDIELLKYLFSLSDEAIIKDGWNKSILRRVTAAILPSRINRRRNKIGFTTPELAWFLRMKNKIYTVFMSQSFARRRYWVQKNVLAAFQRLIEGKNDDSLLFWRLLNLELWLREFFSDDLKPEKTRSKPARVRVDGHLYQRYLVKTDLFKKGDDFAGKIAGYAKQLVKKVAAKNRRPYFVAVSEKVVAISQGRSYFLWDIKPSIWAKILQRFVARTPFGIGLGSPWTMELAIREAGLTRIVLATLVSAATKPFGQRGWFYRVAGASVAAIDGPTEYSLYPSNVSAKLGPKHPQLAAKQIQKQINDSNCLGVTIIDANDIGQKVLGNSTDMDNGLIERIFSDNPMGQSDEQTPVVVVTGN